MLTTIFIDQQLCYVHKCNILTFFASDFYDKNMLTTIFIDQQLVHSNIGYFEIERIVGVELYISVRVLIKSSSISDDLNNSFDYSTLCQIIASESKNSMELLETLGENIVNRIEEVGVVGHQSTWLKIEKKQMLQKGFHAKGFGIELSKDYGQ